MVYLLKLRKKIKIPYYIKVRDLKLQYELARNLVANYNLIKEYNTKIKNIQKEINEALDNKCRTINIEFKGDVCKIKSNAMCLEKKYKNNQDYISLNSLYFSEYGDGLINPNKIDIFNIKIRNSIVYEFKEEDVKELVDLVEKIKNSEISKLFNVFNK